MRAGGRSELSELRWLSISCDDCGRTRRWGRPQILLAEQQGARSMTQLGSKLACRSCVERGGDGHNITLLPSWQVEGVKFSAA